MMLKPTKGQMAFLDWEIGMFFHFGIRSFYPGHSDWDGCEMSLDKFNPVELDCNQWIATAKKLGANYAILTAKHHDGFALWQTKYSEYGVKNTPWEKGKGDVVAQFVEACRAGGLKVGLYYSPAQWGGTVKFVEGKEYDDYFINQITELLGNYGKIDYLWFDGCGSEGHKYDKKRIVSEIFRLQPEILTFCDPEWTPCVRWVGNEDGYASLDNPLVVSSWDFSALTEQSVELENAAVLPAECDCKLRNTWFYADNEYSIKELDELFGMYESSVGRGSNFLINAAPDTRGLIPDADVERLTELGNKINENYSFSLPFGDVMREGENFIVESNSCGDQNLSLALVNTVVVEENLDDGQQIKSFNLYAYLPEYRHKRILVFVGKTIGHKLICRFPAVRASKFTLEITDADGRADVKEIKAYFVK